MRRTCTVVFAATALLLAGLPASAAFADPDDAEGGGTHEGHPHQPAAPPGAFHVDRLFGSPKEGTVNSDLAFWRDLAFAGNYDGFRIFDISRPAQPRLLVDFACRGPQNDVSVYKIKQRLYLFQSIDRPQTAEDCTSQDTPLTTSNDCPPATPNCRATPGFEGIRMFDVTNPEQPRFLRAYRTACGSHTHTLVPDKSSQRLYLYISSYPLGSGISPSPDTFPDPGPRCTAPHRKISIVEIPFSNPSAGSVREKALSSDTTPAPGRTPAFQACHDIQAVLSRDIAVGSCAGDIQIWDISDRGNPTSADGEPHTHITNPNFDFAHSAFVTNDGRLLGMSDETGGGGTAECDGEASNDGFIYFYDVVSPGAPAGPLRGTYMIPRPQGEEICVSHNGNVIPVTDGRYLASVAYYQGGTSIVDFTNPAAAREIAFIDTANSDTWSAYWYNDFVFANGGLHRRAADGSAPCETANRPTPCSNPGFEVYRVIDEDGRTLRTRSWHHLNPQTQERSQQTGS